VLEVVSDRKIGQLLYTYSAVASGTHVYNAQSNEYIYVGTGGNFNQSGSTTEVNYDLYLPEVMSYSDYYPFLMKMPGRNDNSAGYRYQGQGQEEDNEFTEGMLSFEYRVHDPRIGRFLSVDPLRQQYAYNSTYAFSENRVIDAVELEGLEMVIYTEGGTDGQSGSNNAGHAVIAVYDADKLGLIVYSYGRYTDGGIKWKDRPGVLIKYEGVLAENFLANEMMNFADAKAYFIKSADAKKVIEKFDEEIGNSNENIPKNDSHYEEYGDKNSIDMGADNGTKSKETVILMRTSAIVDEYNAEEGRTCGGMVKKACEAAGIDDDITKLPDDQLPKNAQAGKNAIIKKYIMKNMGTLYFDFAVQVIDANLQATVKSNKEAGTDTVIDVTEKEKTDPGSILKE